MTAPRVCRACGAPLAGDVRWCLRCYEPARELTPRAVVWEPGSFVDVPIVQGPSVPHWSRWEKTSTTFGPVGRVAWTWVVGAFVLSSMARSPLMLLFELPLALVVLRGIWARGWVVPGDAPALRLHDALPVEPAARWVRDTGDIRETIGLTVAGLLLMGAIMYGPPIVKFAAIAIAMAAGCVWLVRNVSR